MQFKILDLAKGVARLSEIYTRQRQDLSAALLRDPLLRQAYLLYFFPANLAKMESILQEIWAHPAAHEFMSPNPRILDLGCGPGTHLIGFLDFWVNNPSVWESLEGVAVDSIDANLRESRALFAWQAEFVKAVKPAARNHLQTVVADLARLDSLQLKGEFDFIILANVLNELFIGDECLISRFELISAVAGRWLARRGFLILLEPALRETSRQLLQLRDRLLVSTNLKVYGPCVHNRPCPAVSKDHPKDWCHEDRAWTPPEAVGEVNSLLGNRKDSLKFSYVILSRLGISVKDARSSQMQERSTDAIPYSVQTAVKELQPPGFQTEQRNRLWRRGDVTGSEVWRVVSELMEEKGKASIFLCGERGRCRVNCLNKHRSPTNQAFLCLERGHVVRTDCLKIHNDQEVRVEPESRITIEFSQDENMH